MQQNIDVRYEINFCVKLNKSATKSFHSSFEAYLDVTLLSTRIVKWYNAFEDALRNVDGEPGSLRPNLSTNEQSVWTVS